MRFKLYYIMHSGVITPENTTYVDLMFKGYWPTQEQVKRDGKALEDGIFSIKVSNYKRDTILGRDELSFAVYESHPFYNIDLIENILMPPNHIGPQLQNWLDESIGWMFYNYTKKLLK